MAASVVADTGFLIALLNRRDSNHPWAGAQTRELRPPWITCEAVLSEMFFLLGERGAPALRAMLKRQSLRLAFGLMSLAEACLVRMTEAQLTAYP